MVGALELGLLVGLSGFAVLASLHAWRTREAYGTPRFLGFECLAFLIAWNARRWFEDPVSAPQVASWVVLLGATALAASGFHLLRTVGGAQERVMEDTTTVVEVGVYRYIRHPLYASLALLGWGAFLKGLDLVSATLAAASTACWIWTARKEESFNVTRFGEPYLDYIARTRMFVPFLF